MSKGFEIAEPRKPNDSFAGSRDLWRAYTMRRGAAPTAWSDLRNRHVHPKLSDLKKPDPIDYQNLLELKRHFGSWYPDPLCSLARCVDLSNQVLTVDGPTSKTRRTRHLPLNSEAMSVLTRWREQSGGTDRVFEIATGLKTAWSHLLKRAQITGFQWHDLRITLPHGWFSEGCPSTRCAIS